MMDLQNKRHSVISLIERDNNGIISELHDELNRNLLINPVKASFGSLQSGKVYQMKIVVKNEDIVSQRIVVRPCVSKFAKAFQAEMGPVFFFISRSPWEYKEISLFKLMLIKKSLEFLKISSKYYQNNKFSLYFCIF